MFGRWRTRTADRRAAARAAVRARAVEDADLEQQHLDEHQHATTDMVRQMGEIQLNEYLAARDREMIRFARKGDFDTLRMVHVEWWAAHSEMQRRAQ